MENKSPIWTFLLLFLSIPSYATLVTFQVDMAGETVSSDGVHIIANFNGFSPDMNPLTETSPGSNLYTVVIDLVAGDNIEYKFINGNSYDTGEVEVPPTGCAFAINNNRTLTVPESAATIAVHPFSGCAVGFQMITVNFCIDMAGQNTDDGVFLIGEFYGGFGSFLPLSLVAGQTTVYCVSYDIPEGVTRLNYKYTIGDNYSMAENVVGSCAENSDRFYNLTGANPDDTVLYFFNTCTSSFVLPIQLKSFDVKAEGTMVIVNWETFSESETNYFLLEKSVDGRNFRIIHREAAEGNSQIIKEYDFLDTDPSPGSNYYRLSTYDWDGTVHVEGVRRVKIARGNAGLVSVYPNPSRDYLKIELWPSAEIQTLTITDVFGRVLQIFNLLPNSTNLLIENLTEWRPGVYYLQLKNGREVYTRSFVKE